MLHPHGHKYGIFIGPTGNVAAKYAQCFVYLYSTNSVHCYLDLVRAQILAFFGAKFRFHGNKARITRMPFSPNK